METSSLARRLEEYEAAQTSLRPVIEPAARHVMPSEAAVPSSGKPRRPRARACGIQIRDQGLRPFRVR